MIVVLTLRSDMIPRLQTDPRIPQDALRLYNLPPMPATSLPRVIVGPAERMGLKVDPLLTGALLTDSRGADALPLLAFTLRVMYDGRLDHDRLTLADYEAMGGVRMAIEATARKARSASLAAGIRAEDYDSLLRRSFVPHLVRINESGQPARRVARWAEIDTACHVLLRHLVEQRLLVAGAEGAEPTVEIAHEAVLREWTEVATLVAGHRDYLSWREQVLRQEADHAAGRGDLLTGRALAIAQGFVEDHGAEVSPEVRAFVAASQAAAEADRAAREAERERARRVELEAAEARARDARRAARRIGVFAAAAVVLAVGMAYAMWQANQAGAAAELARESAEAARLTAETERQAADAARQAAEEERRAADLARETAETERQAADAARAAAERETLASESLRLAAQAHDLISRVSLPAGRAVAWLALPHDAALSERPVTDEAATAVYRRGDARLLTEAGAFEVIHAPQGPFVVLVDQTSARVRLINTVTGRTVIDRQLGGWKVWSSWDVEADLMHRPAAGVLPHPVFSPNGDALTVCWATARPKPGPPKTAA